jgi:glucose-1-phosphate adenylyltransferase
VLILSGDQLYQMNFEEMVNNHLKHEADITIATIPVTSREAVDFGILKADENHNITAFTEKPKPELHADWVSDTGEEMQRLGKVHLASMGIYIFNRNVLESILKDEYPEATDFGKEVIPNAIKDEYKVISYQYEGYWTDVGNIPDFFEANMALTDDIPAFNLFDSHNTIYSRARTLPPAKISGTTLEKTVMAEGSIILASRIERTVIGIRARIGHGTTIVNSYIMGNDFYETLAIMEENAAKGIPKIGIGERCYIKNAIIDKNCRIGNDVRINGGTHLENADHMLYTVKEGIVVVKKGAVLPDGFII